MNGFAFGQDAVTARGGEPDAAPFNWLSPAPLAWAIPGFNWSDLPVTPYIHEYAGYNSNVYNTYAGTHLLPGQKFGDSYLRTDLGASSKMNVDAQQFFFDIDYNTTDYLHDTNLDLHNHFFDGGLNWRAHSLCSGNLVGSDRYSVAPQGELVGPGVDIVSTQTVSESGTCHLYQDINVILNANTTSIRHSLPTAQGLDNNTATAQSGLQYAWAGIDSIEALVKYSFTKYVDTTQSGIPEFVRLLNVGITYNYTLSQKLNFAITGGVVESLGLATVGKGSANGPLQPTYAITVNYTPSSKWTVMLSSSRSVSAPTTIVANIQVNTAQTASVSYAWTPKVSLTGTVGLSTTAGAVNTGGQNAPNTYLLFGANTLWNASLRASYQITPFTTASASMQNSSRETNGTHVNTSIVMIGLDYRPY